MIEVDNNMLLAYRRPDVVTKGRADVDQLVTNLNALVNVAQLWVNINYIAPTVVAAAKLDTKGLGQDALVKLLLGLGLDFGRRCGLEFDCPLHTPLHCV